MRVRLLLPLLPASLALPLAFAAPQEPGKPAGGEKPAHQYIGVDKCKLCHIKKTTGEAYTIWKKAKHAKAYETLASDAAKEIPATAESGRCCRWHAPPPAARGEELHQRPAEGAGDEVVLPQPLVEAGLRCREGGRHRRQGYAIADLRERIAAGRCVRKCTRAQWSWSFGSVLSRPRPLVATVNRPSACFW